MPADDSHGKVKIGDLSYSDYKENLGQLADYITLRTF